jgi:hypothetical protein
MTMPGIGCQDDKNRGWSHQNEADRFDCRVVNACGLDSKLIH